MNLDLRSIEIGVKNRNSVAKSTRRLQWSGFIIFDHVAEFPAAATELTQLAARKEIIFDEEILIGLEQAPLALASLYQGTNHGKLIVGLVG
jgi:NADPH-dependent curcumin reductase CurA